MEMTQFNTVYCTVLSGTPYNLSEKNLDGGDFCVKYSRVHYK